MTNIEIELPLSYFNLNQHNKATQISWAVGNKRKQDIQQIIKYQILQQRIKKIKTPAKLVAIWHTSARNFDLDNMLLKTVLDQLQKMELLENDNVNHIQEITHKFELNKKWQGLKLYILEIKE